MAKRRSTATFAGIPAFCERPGLHGNPKIRQCAAVTKEGKRCKGPAMRGKEVCRMHGGKAGRKPSTGVGAYDVGKVSGDIQEAWKRHLENPTMTSLLEEIALVRAYLENYLATFTPPSSQHPPPLTSEFYDTLLGFASRLSRLAKTQAEIEWGPQHLITATQAMIFFNAVMDSIFRHITGVAIEKLRREGRTWVGVAVGIREAIVADLERTTGLADIRAGTRLSLPAPGPAEQGREEGDLREIRVEASR